MTKMQLNVDFFDEVGKVSLCLYTLNTNGL